MSCMDFACLSISGYQLFNKDTIHVAIETSNVKITLMAFNTTWDYVKLDSAWNSVFPVEERSSLKLCIHGLCYWHEGSRIKLLLVIKEGIKSLLDGLHSLNDSDFSTQKVAQDYFPGSWKKVPFSVGDEWMSIIGHLMQPSADSAWLQTHRQKARAISNRLQGRANRSMLLLLVCSW